MYVDSLIKLFEYVDNMVFEKDEQLMVMIADQSEHEVEDLRKYLNSKQINYFGGIFAGLLVGNDFKRHGFIVEKLKVKYSGIVIPFMMRFKLDPETIKGATAIVFADGLSPKMKELSDTLYEKLGDNVNYIGGGAGFYNLEHKPCLFDNKGVYKDAFYVCIVESNIDIAVEHGWKRVQGPFYVSSAHDNVLSELDSENAFEVYKHVIEDVRNITLSKEDFFYYAKDHPFGIANSSTKDIVRDPILLNDDDEIVCVANIPEESDVYILQGDIDTLLESSMNIVKTCIKNAPDNYMPLLFDCISRAMFMEDRFEEELQNIQKNLKYKVQGALSIGEFSSDETGKMQIHNKSTVLGLLEIK